MLKAFGITKSFLFPTIDVKWHNEFGHLVRGDKLTLT